MKDTIQSGTDLSESLKDAVSTSASNSENISDDSNRNVIIGQTKWGSLEGTTLLHGNSPESQSDTCSSVSSDHGFNESNNSESVSPYKCKNSEDMNQLLENPSKSQKPTCSKLNSKQISDDSRKKESSFPSKCDPIENMTQLLKNPSKDRNIIITSLNNQQTLNHNINNEIESPNNTVSAEVRTQLLEEKQVHSPKENDHDDINSNKVESSSEDEGTVPDGGWGWLIVLATTVISVLICSIQGTFGILFSRPLLEMQASSTTIFWIFSYFSVLYYLMGPLMMPLVEVLGWRLLGMAATALVSLSFVISAFATSPYFLIFSFSIIGGIGSGLCLAITHTILPYYFKKYLGIANSFPMGSVCVGGFMLPPFIRYLLDEYTYKGTMFILAGLILNATAAAALFHPPEWHRKKNYKTYYQQTLPQKIISNKTNEACKEQLLRNKSDNLRTTPKTAIKFSERLIQVLKKFWYNLKILKDNQVKIIALGNGLYINSVISFFMFVPFYLQEEGHSLETSAWLVSISSFMNFFARMLFSALSDCKWFNKKICFMMGLFMCIIPILSFPYTTDVIWCTVHLAVFGTGFGCCFSMYALLMVQYVGLKNLGAAYGASSLMITLGFMTIGPLLGYILDVSGNFIMTFWILGSLCITTFILWLFIEVAGKKKINDGKNIQDPSNTV